MGKFDFLKKKQEKQADQEFHPRLKITFTDQSGEQITASGEEIFPDDFEHLTKEGELPFGWIYRNKEFTDKINSEYSYFLNLWIDSRKKSAKEYYQYLKSFVMYLEDAEKLCKSKGEYFELWFYEIIASADYIRKRKNELADLISNFDSFQKDYEKNLSIKTEISEMRSNVILLLKENDGILQSDFLKLFDDEICRASASEIVYALLKEGKIERTKSGRSYILHYKE